MSTVEAPTRLVLSSVEGELSPDEFKSAFRDHPAGVAVVAADAGTGPVAMTVSSLFSVSVVPPLLAFSASVLSSSTETLLAADTIVVHFVADGALPLARLCATSGVDRFSGDVPWERLRTGEPCFLVPGVRVRGEIVATVDAGSSTIAIVRALGLVPPFGDEPQRPVVYHDRAWHRLGEESRVLEARRPDPYDAAGPTTAGSAR